MQYRNTPEKGIITEHNPYAQPQGSVKDMLNFRIIHLSGNRYMIKTVAGTIVSFSINPGYRIIACWDCGEYAVLLSTNGTPGPANGEIGILEFNNPNYEYTPLYNHVDLGFSLSAYAQVRVYKNNNKDHQSYWWNNQNPPKTLNLKNPSLYVTFQPADNLIDGESYMVTQGTVEYPAGSNILYGPSEASTVFTIAAPDVNYVTNAGVPRVIKYDPKVEMLDIIPMIESLADVDLVEKLSSGDLKAGMWFYFVQYEYNNEVRTAWGTATTGIHLTAKMPIVEDWHSFLEYQGIGGQTNIPNDSDETTSSGIRIRISNIDTKYTRIRVAAVRAMDWRIVSQPVLIAEENISGQTSIVIDHTSNRGIFTIADIEILAYVHGILANRTGDLAKRYLFLGNLKERLPYNWNPSEDVTLTPIGKSVLHDTVSAHVTGLVARHPNYNTGPHSGSAYLPLFGHKLLTGFVYAQVWYQVTGGDIEAPAGTAHVDGAVFMYDGSGPDKHKAAVTVTSGTPVVQPVIIINMYGTEKKIIPFNDWYDFKGMAINHYLRSRFRTETYRIGIMPIDLWGIPYGVEFLGDITMPAFFDNISNTTDPDNPVVGPAKPMTNFLASPEIMNFVQTLGIKIDDINFNSLIQSINAINGTTYTISDLDKIFKGFKIVVAPRDEQIVAQGIVYPMFYYHNDGDKFRVVPASAESLFSSFDPSNTPMDGYLKIMRTSPFDINGHIQYYKVRNNYEFLSPEFLMNFNNDHPDIREGDYIEIMGYLADGSKELDNHGTVHTEKFHLYTKYYVITNSAANMVPIGTTTDIDVAKSKNVAELESPIIDVSGTDVLFENRGLIWDWINGHLRTGIGGKKYLLVTKADELTDPDWINGISYHGSGNIFQTPDGEHLKDGVLKCIINIKRDKSTLYGGSSQSALESTVYMPTGHFQVFDTDFITHLLDTSGGKQSGFARNIEIFGGDCYIGFFDFQRILQWGDEASSVSPISNYGMPAYQGPFPPSYNPAVGWKYSNSVIFPVETKINLGMREGRHVAKDRSIGYLNGFLPGNPDGVAFGAGAYDHPESLRYNEAFSTDFIFSLFAATKKLNFYNNHFPNRYIWSAEIGPDSIINPLRQFSLANRKDVAGVFGELVQMRTRLDRLYYWQKYGIGYIGVDERTMVPNSLGQELTVGVSNTGERSDQIDDVYGLQHQSAFTDIPDGFSWFDHRRKAWCVMSFNGQTVQLDVINPNQSLLGNLADVTLPHDSPLEGQGYAMSYNPRLDEILLSLIPGEYYFDPDNPSAQLYYSLGFNLTEKIFTVRVTNAPAVFINFNNKLFSQRDDIYSNQGIDQLQPNTGYVIGQRALNGDDVLICKIAHSTGGSPPYYISQNWNIIGKVSQVHLNDHGKPGEFYGVTHQSEIKFIINPVQTADEEFVYYNFKFNGMDENFFRKVRVRNSYQDNNDDNLDISVNKEYEYRDRKWVSNVPLNSDEARMVDGFLELILTGDNRNVVNGVRDPLSNNQKPISLVSVLTDVKPEF